MSDVIAALALGWSKYSEELEGDRRVLIVDDDAAARTLFTTALSDQGYPCVSVGSGEDALEVFGEERFGAVLVDKNLPGINGLDVVRALHQTDRDCEAVIVTAYTNLDAVLAAIDLRAADFLTKPIGDITEVAATIERAVRRRRRRLLARRMLHDLREAVHDLAADSDLKLLTGARKRVDDFRRNLNQKRVILVASSEANHLKRALPRLADRGFGLVEVRDPEHAIELSAHARADVFIVGLQFGGVGGIELCERIMEQASRPEVIILGEPRGYEHALEALRHGASAFVVKPVLDGDVFLHAVERAWRERHERLYHFRLVAELHGVLAALKARPERRRTAEGIEPLLSEFDVETARLTMALYGVSEDPLAD